MSEALATWENLEVLRQCFPAAPTWGQVGSQEGGECQQPTVRIPRAHRGYDKFKAQEDSEAQCAFQQPGVAVELYK